MTHPISRGLAAALAIVGWAGLVLQLVLTASLDSPISVAGRIVNYFSYFTILSNILAATCLTAVALAASSGLGAIVRRSAVQTAAALYMGVTGLVYTLILSGLWEPAGLQLIADAILHYAMPLLYLVYWALLVRDGTLTMAVIPRLLVFPVLYAVYSLARGPLVDWYPYPFLDPRMNDVPVLALNAVLMMLGFTLFAAMLVAFDRIIGPRSRRD